MSRLKVALAVAAALLAGVAAIPAYGVVPVANGKNRVCRRRGREASGLHRQTRRNRADEADQPCQRGWGIRTRMVT